MALPNPTVTGHLPRAGPPPGVVVRAVNRDILGINYKRMALPITPNIAPSPHDRPMQWYRELFSNAEGVVTLASDYPQPVQIYSINLKDPTGLPGLGNGSAWISVPGVGNVINSQEVRDVAALCCCLVKHRQKDPVPVGGGTPNRQRANLIYNPVWGGQHAITMINNYTPVNSGEVINRIFTVGLYAPTGIFYF